MTEKRPGTRGILLAAAEKLFSEKGYKAVSTRDLAEAAGVNLAAIQYHFGSKAKLFVEVVHHMMEASGCAQARLSIEEPPTSSREAAYRIGRFIFGFLEYLVVPQGPQPCRMMVREVFTDHSEDPEMTETLVASVVEKFMGPSEQALVSVLKVLRPEASGDSLVSAARSITGQCVFYASHRPFLERFPGPDCYSAEGRSKIARHITQFSLAALGCDSQLIDEVLARLLEEGRCGGTI